MYHFIHVIYNVQFFLLLKMSDSVIVPEEPDSLNHSLMIWKVNAFGELNLTNFPASQYKF